MRNKPRIRFKGFTEDWEQRKLSDISTKVTTKNVDVHYTETLTNSAEQGIISQVDFFDKEISNKDNINGYYIVDNNDFIYNPRISTLAPVGPINRNKLNRTGIMSPLYTVFRSSNVDLDFLEWYFQSSHWHRYMKLNGDSGARADRIAIKDSTFFEMPIKIPVNIKEQVLIGETLEKFNQYITLHQRKLEKLKIAKKALLQKLFPKNGSQFPEIRFKGFTDAWEQRKLISLYKTIRNAFVGTATPYYTNDSINGYFYLESNNVKNGKINRNNEIYITKDFYQKQEDKLLYKDDIVIVQSGHVGHTAVIPEELDKTAAHALIMLQNKKENFDSHFINNSFQTPLIRNKIDEITTGNTIKHILASDVKTIVINMPSFKEQKLISQLFKLLDLNITLHQCKLDKLQDVKKGLLQKMFV